MEASKMKHLKCSPYIMLKFRYNFTKSADLISEIHVNKKMVEMIGFKPKFFQLNFLKLDCMSFFRTKDWIQLYSKVMDIISSDDHVSIRLDPDEFYCMTYNGIKIKAEFH